MELATRHIIKATGARPLGFRAPEHRGNAAMITALEARMRLRLQYCPVRPSCVLRSTRSGVLVCICKSILPIENQHCSPDNIAVLELPGSTFFPPFLSELSMRSDFISDVIVSLRVYRGVLTGAPISAICAHMIVRMEPGSCCGSNVQSTQCRNMLLNFYQCANSQSRMDMRRREGELTASLAL